MGADGAIYQIKEAVKISEPSPPPATPPLPIRAQLLNNARDLTLGDRNRSYGDPLENFTVTTDLKRIFWDAVERSNMLKAINHPNDPRIAAVYSQNTSFGHSIDMILANLGRIATTPSSEVQEDRYVDMSNYSAIAYETGLKSAIQAITVDNAEAREDEE